MAKKKAKTLTITLVKSPIGYSERQKRTVRALGLRKMMQSVEHSDSPVQLRGMIAKIPHLLMRGRIMRLHDLQPTEKVAPSQAGRAWNFGWSGQDRRPRHQRPGRPIRKWRQSISAGRQFAVLPTTAFQARLHKYQSNILVRGQCRSSGSIR